MKKSFKIPILLFAMLVIGCGDNQTGVKNIESLVIQIDGVIEELGGDCSAVQVRTRSLGEADLTGTRKLRIELDGMSDADLSSIAIYYFRGNEQVNLVNLSNRDMINSTRSIEVESPRNQTELFSRVTLKSSVCTGQIYFLTFRDLKIFSIR